MTAAVLLDLPQAAPASETISADAGCDECAGTGGWFRYNPAQDDAPGLLYLSCLCCRGSGRTATYG